jgi:hypothetical protein
MGAPYVSCPAGLVPWWWLPILDSGYAMTRDEEEDDRATDADSGNDIVTSAWFRSGSYQVHAYVMEVPGPTAIVLMSHPPSFAASDHIVRILCACGCDGREYGAYQEMYRVPLGLLDAVLSKIASEMPTTRMPSDRARAPTRAPDYRMTVGPAGARIHVFAGNARGPSSEERCHYVALAYACPSLMKKRVGESKVAIETVIATVAGEVRGIE